MAKVRTQIQLEPEEHWAERVKRFRAAAGVGTEPDARRDVARSHDEVLYTARR